VTAPASTPALQLDHVRKSFRRETGESVLALDDISFTLHQGGLAAVVGPDGAGKTTLIRLLAGLMKADGGIVNVLGINAALDPQTIQSRISYMPQQFGLYEDLTVRENLTVFARTGGKGYWTLPRIFDLFPVLRARERNLGFQLSGGEQQMLSIARALMLNPAMLLLDEPSEGLAPMIVQQIIEVLARLKQEGLAILLVEQNLRTAFAVGDRHHGQALLLVAAWSGKTRLIDNVPVGLGGQP